MVRRIKSTVLLVCILGACTQAQAFNILSTSGWKQVIPSMPSLTQVSRSIDRFDNAYYRYTPIVTIGMCGIMAGAITLAVYKQHRNNKRFDRRYKIHEELCTAATMLAEHKKWADTNIILIFNQLNVPAEILANKMSWAYYFNTITPKQIALFTHPKDRSFDINTLICEINVHDNTFQQVFAKYTKLCEALRSEISTNQLSENDKVELAYYKALIPGYLQKLEFVKKLIYKKRYDIEAAQRWAYKDKNTDNCTCCDKCTQTQLA